MLTVVSNYVKILDACLVKGYDNHNFMGEMLLPDTTE